MCTTKTFVQTHERCLFIVQIKKRNKSKKLKREPSQRQDGNAARLTLGRSDNNTHIHTQHEGALCL